MCVHESLPVGVLVCDSDGNSGCYLQQQGASNNIIHISFVCIALERMAVDVVCSVGAGLCVLQCRFKMSYC